MVEGGADCVDGIRALAFGHQARCQSFQAAAQGVEFPGIGVRPFRHHPFGVGDLDRSGLRRRASRKAERKVPRLTSSCSASEVSTSRCPWGSSPLKICSRSRSAARQSRERRSNFAVFVTFRRSPISLLSLSRCRIRAPIFVEGTVASAHPNIVKSIVDNHQSTIINWRAGPCDWTLGGIIQRQCAASWGRR